MKTSPQVRFTLPCFAAMALAFSLLPMILRASSWVHVYGGPKSDAGWGIIATSDGGYLVTGGTDSYGAGHEDALLMKLDAQGAILWTHVFGGRLDDEFEEAVETPDGGYALSGMSYSFSRSGYLTPWVVRLDTSGNVLWQKYYTTALAAGIWGITNTQDGGFAVCGKWWDAQNLAHPYLIKLSTTGDTEWQQAFGPDVGALYSVRELSGGGYVAAGFSYEAVIGGQLGEVVLRTDALGNLLWMTRLKIPNDFDSEDLTGCDVIETQDGGLLFAGGNPAQIRKLDKDGNTLWSQRFLPRDGLWWATATSLVSLPEEGYYAAGYYDYRPVDYHNDVGGALLTKLSNDGTVLWSKVYDGNAQMLQTEQGCLSPDGGVLLVGVLPWPGGGQENIVIAKAESDGSLSDPCITTYDMSQWLTSEVSSSGDITQDPLPASCEALVPTPKAVSPVLDFSSTLCPVIYSVTILPSPFRLDVRGFGLLGGTTVYIDGKPVPGSRNLNNYELIAKGGSALKAMLPKGQPVCLQVQALSYPAYQSDCFMFRR